MTEHLKLVGIEEHIFSPELRDILLALPLEVQGVKYPAGVPERLTEIGPGRIQDMESQGVDQQVLSVTTPATQVLEPTEAVRLCRQANDLMAKVVSENPERFPAALATLPMTDPSAAVDEIERCVTQLGLKGSMIHGRTGDRYLDHPDFAGVLDKSAELGAPVFIHPQRPAKPIADYLYGGDNLPETAAWMLSTGAWGWHVDTGLNAIRLVLSGAFDRAPGLQVILGHWGEMVPFWLSRLNEMFLYFGADAAPFADTFREHFWVAPSGLWSYPMMQHAIAEMGVDHIVFATDYPFILSANGEGRRFIEEAPISPADKEKIGHANLEALLHLNGA